MGLRPLSKTSRWILYGIIACTPFFVPGLQSAAGHAEASLLLLLLPVVLCAAIGGPMAALASTAVSTLAADYLLFEPVAALRVSNASDLRSLLSFALLGLAITAMSWGMHRVLRRSAANRQSLQELATLVDAAGSAIVATDGEGLITRWSRGAELLFGYRADEALGLPYDFLLPPGDRLRDRRLQQRVIAGEDVAPVEGRFLRKDGVPVDALLSVSALRDAGGCVVGVARVCSDLSRHRQAEEARTDAELKFQALVESSVAGFYMVQDGRLCYLNPAFASIFGYEPGDLYNAPLEKLCAAEELPTVERNIRLRLDGTVRAIRYNSIGLRCDGSRIAVGIHGSVFMQGGRPAIIGALVDMTEVQRSREELKVLVEAKTAQLRQREQVLQTILDNVPAMIGYFDRDMNNRFANRAYHDWHGSQSGELLGKHLSQIHSDSVYGDLLPYVESTLAGEAQSFEIAVDRTGGPSARYLQVHLVRDTLDGRVQGFYSMSMDVTPMKQAQNALRDSEEHFRQLFDAAPVAMGLYRADGCCVMANQALATLVGASREQLMAHDFHHTPAWRESGLLVTARRALSFRGEQRLETHFVSSLGQRLEVDCEFTLPLIKGEVHLLMVCRNLASQREAERMNQQALEAEQSRQRADQHYRHVLENLTDGFYVTDLQGRLLEVNDAYSRVSGYDRETLLRMHVGELEQGLAPDAMLARLQSIAEKRSIHFETLHRRRDGTVWPIEVSASYSPADGGKIFVFSRDITERKRTEDEIRTLAFYDPLTQLPNRQLLMDRLRQALRASQRSGHPGALLFLDLDNFKQLNDTLGHNMGDQLLVKVARRLKACVRERDTVARLGGDEFIIVLEGMNVAPEKAAAQARQVAGKIVKSLDRPYLLGLNEYNSTTSIGVTLFYGQTEKTDELLKQADLAMYQAKSSGRNTVCFFDPVIQSAVENRSMLEKDLRRSLTRDHILLYFQPQVDRHGRLIGAESLVRWHHPARGVVGPDEFIGLAEESGLILPLGQRVLELACEQLARWHDDPVFNTLTLAVNVSARQFRHPDFVPQIRRLLDVHGIRRGRLKLELTESLLLQNVNESIKKMVELWEMGVNFSLDDFGTGYSSLAYLKELPLEQLKIDRSFVNDILSAGNDAAIVRAIITMGHNLGLSVVAEGVESQAQWDILLAEGCDIGQGFHFNRPMPIEEFEQVLGLPGVSSSEDDRMPARA
ncbi:PAS domain S-box protein [Paludibacterium yongneupense]|uniref:PAS domain S-box protein n=1 Tax=Paludibacterium yongneupense TaxID=400061 RepID=UPI000421B247|nr:PAS domain S-box protein [Paludibacterium yongneupense]